ncbi:aminoglycoside phosphotransferase family protein [Bradyrhizobium sp. CCBAU 53340]|uniref:phosphotransferase family protein n=1 Tax=Bradyrhizobium sp. CCBAU 53340 TaxID=1325112 RepID=UPI00188A9790|nr:aminoglycoside phosphotransferase family protein [Bradyrhizobium sp. CCBAU 53340]QOZ44025.1 aminoglycoside phosphotransferase family protein [Bradyrhizobium sp. CCBAU 53340]
MLGKIAFFETCDRIDIAADRAAILPALQRHLQSDSRATSVTPALGGTLGICFDAEIAGEKRFLKTHLPGRDARASLAREIDILIRLYGDTVVRDRFEVTLGDGSARLCLLMPALTPLPGPMQPADAAALMHGCHERLADWQPDDLPTFQHYLSTATRALKTLSERDLLEQASATELRLLMSVLEERYPTLPTTLCHGDFGPKNIMLDGAEPRIIDWEDAFLGIDGYDYLYWLTFMENRPFLQTAAFGRTGLAPDIERAILALVVLLKSYLAVCSGAYLKHAVSAEARITEILQLPL